MSNQLQTTTNTEIDPNAVRKVLLHGDLSSLTPDQKDQYYMAVCKTVGLNHLTKPFDFLRFQGKEVMYANKGCAEQLRMVHKIGLKIVDRQKIDDVYVVTAEAIGSDGRVDSATGAVPVTGLKGDALANAFMKAETKAKRRVTLSICGLNMLDETETETIQGAEKVKTVTSVQIIEGKQNETVKSNQSNAQSDSGFYSSTGGTNYEQYDVRSSQIGSPVSSSGHIAGYESTVNENYLGSYVIQIGKNKNKTFEEVGPQGVDNLFGYFKKLEFDGKSVEGYAREVMNKAPAWFEQIGYKSKNI